MGAMFANLLKTTYQLQQSDKQQQQQQHFSLPRRQVVTYALYALIAVALLYLFVDPASPAAANPSSSSVVPPWIQEQEDLPPPPPASSPPPTTAPPCDYSDGEWVPDPRPPLYNGTTCHAIKDGRSCTANGQTDTGYVHWRWRPWRCDLPAFSPELFLRWLRNRHVAFVGDSLARNQAESLVCLLSSRSPAALVPGSGGDGGRFRRWVFPEHNATVSTFWSPFLVKGAEKSGGAGGAPYNRVFLDAFDERWMSELGAVDAAVLSAGHWFKIPSVYYHHRDGGAAVVGCHGCAAAGIDGNHTTETSFLAAFRDAVGRTLAEVARRHDGGREKVVAVATFSPSHFEGDWSKGAPCPKKRPYRKGEKELGRTEAEMRRIVVEAVAAAAAEAKASSTLRFAALDVTTLADMRPDGHPGPYMRKNPFAGGGDGPVQNDCLHWCMPGPVDTFNQILLQTILH